MSTSETDEFEVMACPCGAGLVMKYVTTYENAWSGADTTYGISCHKCSKEWSAGRGHLTHLEDDRANTSLFRTLMDAEDAITKFMEPEIDAYFANPKFRDMAKVQREMMRLSLSPRDIRNFRIGRAQGKRYSELCRPFKNRSWLTSLASGVGKAEELSALCDAREAAIAAYETHNVRKIHFPADRR